MNNSTTPLRSLQCAFLYETTAIAGFVRRHVPIPSAHVHTTRAIVARFAAGFTSQAADDLPRNDDRELSHRVAEQRCAYRTPTERHAAMVGRTSSAARVLHVGPGARGGAPR